MEPPRKLQKAIISRVKIMASMDIAERRKPQDGKFQIKMEGRQVDFRVIGKGVRRLICFNTCKIFLCLMAPIRTQVADSA